MTVGAGCGAPKYPDETAEEEERVHAHMPSRSPSASWVCTSALAESIAHPGTACWSACRPASCSARAPDRPDLCASFRADPVVESPTTWKSMHSSRAARSRGHSSCSRVKPTPSRIHLVLHAPLDCDRPPARNRGRNSCSRVKTGRPRLHLDIHALASGLLGRSGVAAAPRASVLRLRNVFATSGTCHCSTDAPPTCMHWHHSTTSNRWGTADH